jgi:hypothetical protein
MSKRSTQQPRLSLNPQAVGEHVWYYEEPGGLDLIVEVRDNGGSHLRTDHYRIPWSRVAKSVDRWRATRAATSR